MDTCNGKQIWTIQRVPAPTASPALSVSTPSLPQELGMQGWDFGWLVHVKNTLSCKETSASFAQRNYERQY